MAPGVGLPSRRESPNTGTKMRGLKQVTFGDGLQELHLFGLQREGKGEMLLPTTASGESTEPNSSPLEEERHNKLEHG